MEITTTTVNQHPGRRAAVNTLAIVGFIALILMGIALAIYTAQYGSKLGSKLNGAAVSLSSIFNRDGDDEDASLQVVTATSSLAFDTEPVEPITFPADTAEPTKPASTGSGVVQYRTVTTTTTVEPYGDPDLTVTINDVGYLRRDGKTDTFVADRSIDDDDDGAVRFTVKNVGTNVTGSWKFKATVPSNPSQTFTSPTQRSLKPGDSIEFTLGFTKPRKGDDRTITVVVDSGRNVDESNERNNEDSATVDIDS